MKLGNYIDIAITVFLIFSLVMGFRNGLIKSLVITPVVDNVILVLLIYIIATIFIFLLFHMLKDLMSQDMLSLSDKILGALFSGLKSVIVIMIIVYALDIISDTVLSKSTKDLLSQSFLLPKFFYYNIFMWIGK